MEAADDTDTVEWLVAVGRFVQDRWLAEEASKPEGEELDEHAVWHVWDGCTEKQIRDLRAEAGIALKAYVARNGLIAAREWVAKTFQPVAGLVAALNWIFWQFLRGIVSGLAIIILGLLIVTLAPEVVRKARGNLDTILPADTSPHQQPATSAP